MKDRPHAVQKQTTVWKERRRKEIILQQPDSYKMWYVHDTTIQSSKKLLNTQALCDTYRIKELI